MKAPDLKPMSAAQIKKKQMALKRKEEMKARPMTSKEKKEFKEKQK